MGERFGTGIETQIVVDGAHDVHHASSHLRILREAGVNVLGGFVEDLACGDGVAARFPRIGNAEHFGHEVGDAVGAITFASGAVALGGNPADLDGL